MKAKGLYEDLEREMTAVQMQAKAIEDELSVWPADLMDKAGCVVHVGQNGAVAVKYGLISTDTAATPKSDRGAALTRGETPSGLRPARGMMDKSCGLTHNPLAATRV